MFISSSIRQPMESSLLSSTCERRQWLCEWVAEIGCITLIGRNWKLNRLRMPKMRINNVIFWKLFYVGRFVHSADHFVSHFPSRSLDFCMKIIIATTISSAPNMIESHSSDRNIQYTTIYSFFFLTALCVLARRRLSAFSILYLLRQCPRPNDRRNFIF